MSRCVDCGTKKDCGICPWCYEELYINDYQMPEFGGPVSKEWVKKVKEQRDEIKLKKLKGIS